MFTCSTCEKTYISARHNNLPPLKCEQRAITRVLRYFSVTDINLLIKLHIHIAGCLRESRGETALCTLASIWAAADMTHTETHTQRLRHTHAKGNILDSCRSFRDFFFR